AHGDFRTWSGPPRPASPGRPASSGRPARRVPDRARVGPELAPASVFEVPAQGLLDRAKRDLLPRNLGLGEQPRFEAFRAGVEFRTEHLRPEEHVDLVDVRYVEHRKQRADPDPGAGLLDRLALRAFSGGLAVLHEAGRQRPVAIARLDGPAAQQHPVFPDG